MSSIAQAHVADVTSSAKVAQRKNPHVIPPIGMHDAEPTTPRRDQTQSGTQAPDRRRSWLAPPPTPATPGASSDFGWFVSASPAPMSPREKFSPDDPFSSDTPPIFSPRYATRWRRWITSTVITDPRDWCDESLLVMHEAIRLDLERADSALTHLRADADGRAAWKLENFFTWFREYHCPNVRHHRDAKEQIYVPWIESRYELPPPARGDHTLRAAGRVFSPSKLAADHEAQLKQMQIIDGLFTSGEKLNRWATEALITSLQMEWKQYRALTEAHFAKEEALVPALLRSGKFTVEEKAATVGQILESLGLAGNKAFLPLILDAMARWGGARKVAEFKQTLPPSTLFLHAHFWQPDYEQRQLLLLRSLMQDDDPFAPQPGFAFCGVLPPMPPMDVMV